jgi:flagellar hook-associated protein 2
LISDPSLNGLVIDESNNTIKLKINGRVSEDIVLTNKTYNSFSELATELQTKIDEDDNIGSYGVEVSYVDTGDSGYIELTSGSYGSSSKVEYQAGVSNSALTALGLAQGTITEGYDVAGTINGEEAKGVGQLLTGESGNDTTEGLRLKVELEESDLADGSEATISIVKGVASQFDSLLDSLTKSSEGLLARKASAIQKQIDYTADRIEDEEERLAIRKQALFKKFIAMEELINEFNSQGAFLEGQLSQISANWNYGKGTG